MSDKELSDTAGMTITFVSIAIAAVVLSIVATQSAGCQMNQCREMCSTGGRAARWNKAEGCICEGGEKK